MTAKDQNTSVMPQKKKAFHLPLGLVMRLVLLAAPALAVPLAGTADTIIFNGDFENGNLSGWGKEFCCQDSVQLVNSPVRGGSRAAKFTLDKNDPDVNGSKRSELRSDSAPRNAERWYGFSVYLPSNYGRDESEELIAQWHGTPDFDKGEGWVNPPLALMIRGDKFQLGNSWDADEVTVFQKYDGSKIYDLEAVQKGKWTDFVVHTKWSHLSDGLLELWIDGRLVLRKQGPNCYNNRNGLFMKFGIYKPVWKYDPNKSKLTQRVIYHDNIKIGDANASYKDVASSSSLPSPQPNPQPEEPQSSIFEDFSASASNFTVELGGGWSVSSDKYLLTANASQNVPVGNGNVSVHKTPLANNFTLTTDASATATSSSWDDFSIIFNYQDAQNYYYTSFNEANDSGTHGVFRVLGGVTTQLTDFNSLINAQTTYNIKVERTGDTIKVYRNGTLQGTASDSTFTGGKVGFGSRNNPATFDNLRVE